MIAGKKERHDFTNLYLPKKPLSGNSGMIRRIILFLFLFPVFLFAQTETLIIGQVFSKYEKTPLPLVNVYFKNTHTGTTSNNEGYFVVRSSKNERTLVFSSVGYKTKEIKIKTGQPAYLDVELEEENTWLQDVMVFPGINPALEWMKKIRLVRKQNDITSYPDYKAESVEQDLILLNQLDERILNKKLLNQLQKGTLYASDSSQIVPLYMAESTYQITNRTKTEVSRNIFSTPEITDNLVAQISKGIDPDLNFYNNSVAVFGKSIISPLAGVGNAYYNYYLADSVGIGIDKQYEIHFQSKNQKNLAFNGKFRFDSASLALTYIETRLPGKANINYVEDLRIKQEFESISDNRWAQKNSEMTLKMSYGLITDSLSNKPGLLVRQTGDIKISDSISIKLNNFAKSEYSTETLESKMQELDNTPLMRTAKWMADVVLTGYARVGFLDIGPLPQLIRLTDIEGVRLNVPLRTNEHLWKNISIGGYAGYGFRNKKVKYAVFGQFRLPTEKRSIFEIRYTDDYRRIDYDYNNYLLRESVWNLADADIISTIFSFVSTHRISPRKEWSFSYTNDWNKNIESRTFFRINRFFSNEYLPLSTHAAGLSSFDRQSITSLTRFSFGEKKYEDHLNRIYIQNTKPVIYGILEGGRYKVADKAGYYGKIIGAVKQRVRLDLGEWNYMAQAGWVFGRVPYPLLEIPQGNEPSGNDFYHLNKIKYFEFGFDKYIQLNNEFVFNGIIFNHIPLIKNFNFRELIALKVVVGDLSGRHREVLDFPEMDFFLHKMQNPYVEGSIGITNLLRIFTIQLNWRFTNVYDGIYPRRVAFGLRFDF